MLKASFCCTRKNTALPHLWWQSHSLAWTTWVFTLFKSPSKCIAANGFVSLSDEWFKMRTAFPLCQKHKSEAPAIIVDTFCNNVLASKVSKFFISIWTVKSFTVAMSGTNTKRIWRKRKRCWFFSKWFWRSAIGNLWWIIWKFQQTHIFHRLLLARGLSESASFANHSHCSCALFWLQEKNESTFDWSLVHEATQQNEQQEVNQWVCKHACLGHISERKSFWMTTWSTFLPVPLAKCRKETLTWKAQDRKINHKLVCPDVASTLLLKPLLVESETIMLLCVCHLLIWSWWWSLETSSELLNCSGNWTAKRF